MESAILGQLGCPDGLASLLLDPRTHGYVAAVLGDYMRDPRNSPLIGRDDVGDDVALLLRHPRFIFTIQTYRRPSAHVHSITAPASLVLLCPEPIVIDEYRIAAPIDYAVFEPGTRLVHAGRRPYRPGEVIHQDPADLTIHEWTSPAPIVELKIGARDGVQQIWHFARDTLEAEFASLATTSLSARIVMSQMMASLRERRALPILETLTAHPAHVVRWAAIQAIGGLDGARARALLRAAVDDPHPHIRASARAIVERLEGAAA